MSNSLPEKEPPVKLRASTALDVRREQDQAPAAVPAGQLAPSPTPGLASPEQSRQGEEGWPTAPVLTASGLAVLLGAGWLLQRRQRLAHRAPKVVEAEPVVAAAATPAPDPVEQAAAAEPLDAMAAFASQFENEPPALQPQQSFPAPLEHRHHHSRMAVASQKRLIKGLMWVRTVASGAAILAAIAIVVFWAIETTDMRAGDTGLTKPLLVVLLAAWAASWGAGRLANQLHRVFFGRVHPKFDN